MRRGSYVTTNEEVLMAIREHEQSLSKSEHDRWGFHEIVEVVEKNIGEFATQKFSNPDITLFCKANFAEGSLNDKDFVRAIAINKSIYANLIPSLGVSHRKAMKWAR